MCLFGGLKSVPASGGRKRTFVGEFCVQQHLLREVNATPAEICLAQRHFGPFSGRLWLPYGLLMCSFGGLKSVPASRGRKRTFVGEFCVQQNLLREVSAIYAKICLARRHFWTLHWALWLPFGLLMCALGGLKSVPASGGRQRTFSG